MIIGDIPNVTSVSIGWQENPEDAEREIAAAIGRVESGKGTVVLTDMFGGTPSNLAISVMETGRVEVIAGMNLPMLIKLSSVRKSEEIGVAVDAAQAAGRKYINVASRLLAGK